MEARNLKQYGELPDTVKINEGMGGDDDELLFSDDPEAAAKKKDDERRAKQVEAMLADIMKNKGGDDGPSDHAESPKNGDAVGVGTPLFGKKK